ncbi:WSC domain-containing protein 2-like [Mytilus californianus]|uniref:WSC domain-containing protein 2-like n=1 Tax=Mytilus californianus TaxID=6549 RepID=UPI0022451006|nr:WSC domain-containing protein 2-like [Mytilus californianus]XP_052076613.1 WSC domain-containing protein 2-like [Mytilus californianus]
MRSLFVCILVFVGTQQLVRLDEIGQCVSLIEQVATEGYLGCFRDIDNTMLPSRTVKGFQKLTLKKCQQQCQGYTFLGLQFADECFCGNNLNTDQFISVPESDCNMKCSGENRMCGSGHRNSVYRVPF